MRSEPDGERGVSEVIGFVLVFTLVIGSITVVYAGGFSALDSTRDGERVNNAERAFDVLANNFETLGRNQAPRRATEIKLSDAQLTLDERHPIRVNVSGNLSVTGSRPLTYHSGTGTRITYEHGAIIRVDDDGGAVMLREPDFLFTDEHTVIRHIELRGGEQSLGGTTTVLIRGKREPPELEYPAYGEPADISGEVNITISTTSERTAAWLRYLKDQSQLTNCEDRPVANLEHRREIECDILSDALTFSGTKINVEIT